ncbi:MAG: putative Glycosyl transferase group 1 [Gemmatimonadetes bacterium]|nr:putative Glycosyl transferase group 1 [Gemmatimonadota bacterium]
MNVTSKAVGGRMTSELVARVPVVFVLDNMRLGGTELNAVRTAALLDRSRFDLRVACMSGEGPLSERYRAMGIPVETFPLESLYGTSMLTNGYRFARYLREQQIQIVHAHDMYSNIFMTPWTQLARTRVVIASRRWWFSLPSKKLQYGNLAAFRLADVVLANSPQVARSVTEAEGIPAARIRVISNFVDDRAFERLSDERRREIRQAWGIPAGRVVIGCVARLVSVKDHGTLVRAFGRVSAAVPNVHLVLVGDGDCRQSLEALATELRVSDSVTFAGELRSGENHHRAFDISVLCSLSEGFPNSLVEAMAAEVPIVATEVGGNVDAVTHGLNGLLVPSQRPVELADALLTLVKDDDERVSMGRAGRIRASERYRAAEAVASLEHMYEQLLAERRA